MDILFHGFWRSGVKVSLDHVFVGILTASTFFFFDFDNRQLYLSSWL